jgi:glycosyltransferase involved in cell wall biosynthesis
VRIAIEASTWINPRGYGRFTRELTLALLRASTRHTFTLVVDSGAARAPDLPDADIVSVPTRQSVSDAATADGSRSIADVFRVARRLSRGFDAILFPTNYSFVPVLPGPFVVVVIHDALPEAMPELVLQSRRARALWTLKNRLVTWRSDLIATVSNASAAAIHEYLGIDRGKLLVLTEGASAIFSSRAAADDGRLVSSVLGGADRFVLFVGGISPHKRVADLVRAFGVVCAEPPYQDVRLVLAGPGDKDQFAADRSGVADAIGALGPHAARVIETGFVPDATLAALYRAAQCVVLPSSMEGFGLPALEAMASGAPLIVARNAALVELCGDAAEYVDTIDALPAILRHVLGDASRRAELARAGPDRARQFGWDEAARRILGAFDRAS